MIFSTLEYFIFFFIYFSLYKVLKPKYSIYLIILGSLFFYGWWNPVLIWVPAVLCSIAYIGAFWVNASNENNKKFRISVTVISLLLPLIVFKYIDFFYNDMFAELFSLTKKDLQLVLPLGISFITFTMISYVVDVFRKDFPLEKSYLQLVGYTLFFPQLIAGPILRPAQLIPQLIRSSIKKNSVLGLGLFIFTVGLVKKVVFADGISPYVNIVFNNPLGHGIVEYWIAIFGFALQIYCDFSGYTDMAIGSAMMLGVRLPLNFNRPYAAASLRDFWLRWHITLSRWLRDYLYIPLGGNRTSKPQHVINIFITMVLGGLWHGSNWTFLIWGALHGFGIAINHSIHYFPTSSNLVKKVPTFFWRLLTIAFVIFAWIFFRANNINDAFVIIDGAISSAFIYDSLMQNIFPLFLLLLFAITHYFDSQGQIRLVFKKANKIFLYMIILILWIIVIASATGSSQEFIYFDF
jgi:alginate O-acetyltransferase complex protein AlgI